MEFSDRSKKSMEELFIADRLTPEELSRLIDMPVDVITRAAYAGELKAEIVNHDIVSISRDDALSWLASR
jgi:hypothetical protein